MCGIIGIQGMEDVFMKLYDGLLAMQHRGQDAAGAATFHRSSFYLKKGYGLVRDVFDEKHLSRLEGRTGIAHVRYSTFGNGGVEDAQPFMVNHPYGIVMAHNGQVTNYPQLKNELLKVGKRRLNSTCDAEAILNVFADELGKQDGREIDHIFAAVDNVFRRVKGSYSVVCIIADRGLLAFRDPHGIRPLIMGKLGGTKSYAVGSESAALDILGYRNKEDIAPGSAVFIDMEGTVHRKQLQSRTHTPCIFEYVYFARPDSFIDKISVYETRIRFGRKLAKACEGLDVDVVIPVPDSARPAAVSMAFERGIPYKEGLVKNRYIGRTFIMPEQGQRKRSVRRKMNPIRKEFSGNRVLMVDDSIVRGNTSREIVKIARESGAKEVYFVSCSPPLKHPCVYGIDMSTKGDFLANGRNMDEITEFIGADRVIYQSLEDMVDAVREGNPELTNFCTACFTGEYPTSITLDMLMAMEENRLEKEKKV